MRIANHDGRSLLVIDEQHGVDIAEASNGQFGPTPEAVLQNWDEFTLWAKTLDTAALPTLPIERSLLGSPSPMPRQVIAVGLNYSAHAAESGFDLPDQLPPTFTKFVSSITGPDTDVQLPPGGHTDWEVELVVIIGRAGHCIAEADAWDHVAGLSVGQDLSERISQLQGPAPQFSLGKSFPGFAPIGPWLVTPDDVGNRDDLALGCAIDGEIVQEGRTRDLLFPVAALIARLSATITLLPGDVIFTGTPAGVGVGRTPARFLQPGESLRSWIEGIGELNQRFLVPADPAAGPNLS
ncbi:fumarylacetoacetate hydrolase family protein [Microbacterium sp. 22303]|uniref:fumarylacetoacetate hydrolase family protein n=1 Tax=Microbacterium sp. 22303 TaxID=3453905 RepID=UPI003F84738B